MSPSDVLRDARKLLVNDGWTGPAFQSSAPPDWGPGAPTVPTCRDGAARPVSWRDEGVTKFTITGAIANAARGDEASILGAWALLQRAVAPVHHLQDSMKLPERTAPDAEWAAYRSVMVIDSGMSELQWFEAEGRTLSDVVRAIDKAINSAPGKR